MHSPTLIVASANSVAVAVVDQGVTQLGQRENSDQMVADGHELRRRGLTGQDVEVLVKLERIRSGLQGQIAIELNVRTGQRFDLESAPLAAATAFWAREGNRFVRGALHKFGHAVPMPNK